MVEGHRLSADLILLHMRDFDAILGIDWLSSHHATLIYHEKAVRFYILGIPDFYYQRDKRDASNSLISFLHESWMLKKGCDAYLAYVNEAKKESSRLEDI